MAALLEIVRADTAGVTSFSLREKNLPRIVTFPDPSVGVAATAFTAQPENFFSHPVATNYIQTLDGSALAISDFLSAAELYVQAPLYSEFLRPVGIEDQMGIYFELPSGLKTCQKLDLFHHRQEHISLILSRDRRNFTERERLILNLIRPHIKQAYDTLVAFHQLHDHLTQQQSATDQTALIALSACGTVQWITQKAGEILHRYFPPSKAAIALPDLLQQWVGRQLAMVAQLEEVCKLARPLRLQLEGRRLAIRFSFCPRAGQLYLLLEETEQEQFSIEALQLLGLTKRESEVLFWVAKDKSMVEVAKLLGMSDRTAKKHLEHIYEKLDVSTRLSAVMYALEHLGIFV
ncbi:helix-turn-helix transcriptional regulator [Phormidium tenue]|uniref:helix-turn-helix transcriptional regulator n=1 Tax=Phormidium tenue TaxID=126344 RepID=UPI000A05A811|nr:helix-turn-helix transcriptional regulator [Phormidium tenue]MBD2233155.1 helix-turn-helix transcriptional regulator [Phormidium tenue FACHB-1052]